MEPIFEHSDDILVITLTSGYLDASNSAEFKQHVLPALEKMRKVVLDCSSVAFMDSAGCGSILTCLRHLNAKGGELKLAGVGKRLRSLFELVRMHRIVDIFAKRDEAMAAFGAPAIPA